MLEVAGAVVLVAVTLGAMLEVAGAVVLVAADHVRGLADGGSVTLVGVHGVAPWATLAETTLVALAKRLLGVGPGRSAVRVVARAPAVVLEGDELVLPASLHAAGGAVAVTLGAVLEVAGTVVLVAA